MISVLTRPTIRGRLDVRRLRRRLARTLQLLKHAHAEICVLLTDDSEIQELNREYRDRDSATDVLSFSQYDDSEPQLPGHPVILGDIIISVETAERQVYEGCLPRLRAALQAQEATRGVADAWTLDDEIACLMVHGVLHLLGHDHMVPEEADVMFSQEALLLPQLLRHRPI